MNNRLPVPTAEVRTIVRTASRDLPPDWLIDAVPGARDALDKVEKLRADAAPLRAAVGAASNARRGKVAWRGEPGDAVMVPAPGVSTAEFERLNSELAEAEAASGAHARKVKAAKDAFDRLIADARANGSTRPLAARVALEKHATAVKAWEELQSALDARDTAWDAAGGPGRDWSERAWASGSQADNAQTQAARAIGDRINDFDVAATEAVSK